MDKRVEPAKKQLRRELREARRAVSDAARSGAAEAVACHLDPWLATLRPGTAAATIATDGELSPAPVVGRLRELGWRIAYPRIAHDTMTFHLVADEATLVQGDWGLLEPAAGTRIIAPADIDLVLVPLVGFDTARNRLGRGKAYYDQAFASVVHEPLPHRPMLIGLAHDVQRVAKVPTEAHDVALDTVVTPTTIHGSLPLP